MQSLSSAITKNNHLFSFNDPFLTSQTLQSIENQENLEPSITQQIQRSTIHRHQQVLRSQEDSVVLQENQNIVNNSQMRKFSDQGRNVLSQQNVNTNNITNISGNSQSLGVQNFQIRSNPPVINVQITQPNVQFLKELGNHYSQIQKYENFLQDIKKVNSSVYPNKLQVSLVSNPPMTHSVDRQISNPNIYIPTLNLDLNQKQQQYRSQQNQEKLLNSSSVFLNLKGDINRQNIQNSVDQVQIYNPLQQQQCDEPYIGSGFYSSRFNSRGQNETQNKEDSKYKGFTINLTPCLPYSPRNNLQLTLQDQNQAYQSHQTISNYQQKINLVPQSQNGLQNQGVKNKQMSASQSGFNSHRAVLQQKQPFFQKHQNLNQNSRAQFSPATNNYCAINQNNKRSSRHSSTSTARQLSQSRRQDNSDLREVYTRKEEDSYKFNLLSNESKNESILLDFATSTKNSNMPRQTNQIKISNFDVSPRDQEQIINARYLDISTIQSDCKTLSQNEKINMKNSKFRCFEEKPIQANKLTFEQLLDKEIQRESIGTHNLIENNIQEIPCHFLFDEQSKSIEFEPSPPRLVKVKVNLDDSTASQQNNEDKHSSNETFEMSKTINPKPFLKRGEGHITKMLSQKKEQITRNSSLESEQKPKNKKKTKDITTKEVSSSQIRSTDQASSISSKLGKSLTRNQSSEVRHSSLSQSARRNNQNFSILYSDSKTSKLIHSSTLSNFLPSTTAQFNNDKKNYKQKEPKTAQKQINAQTEKKKSKNQVNRNISKILETKELFQIPENEELLDNLKQSEISKLQVKLQKLTRKSTLNSSRTNQIKEKQNIQTATRSSTDQSNNIIHQLKNDLKSKENEVKETQRKYQEKIKQLENENKLLKMAHNKKQKQSSSNSMSNGIIDNIKPISSQRKGLANPKENNNQENIIRNSQVLQKTSRVQIQKNENEKIKHNLKSQRCQSNKIAQNTLQINKVESEIENDRSESVVSFEKKEKLLMLQNQVKNIEGFDIDVQLPINQSPGIIRQEKRSQSQLKDVNKGQSTSPIKVLKTLLEV